MQFRRKEIDTTTKNCNILSLDLTELNFGQKLLLFAVFGWAWRGWYFGGIWGVCVDVTQHWKRKKSHPEIRNICRQPQRQLVQCQKAGKLWKNDKIWKTQIQFYRGRRFCAAKASRKRRQHINISILREAMDKKKGFPEIKFRISVRQINNLKL